MPVGVQHGDVARDNRLDEVRRLEADNLRAALRRTRGKVSGAGGAAELLGVKPTTLASRIKALGVSPSKPPDPSGLWRAC